MARVTIYRPAAQRSGAGHLEKGLIGEIYGRNRRPQIKNAAGLVAGRVCGPSGAPGASRGQPWSEVQNSSKESLPSALVSLAAMTASATGPVT